MNGWSGQFDDEDAAQLIAFRFSSSDSGAHNECSGRS
jgi:hypothetical protein